MKELYCYDCLEIPCQVFPSVYWYTHHFVLPEKVDHQLWCFLPIMSWMQWQVHRKRHIPRVKTACPPHFSPNTNENKMGSISMQILNINCVYQHWYFFVLTCGSCFLVCMLKNVHCVRVRTKVQDVYLKLKLPQITVKHLSSHHTCFGV